MADTIREHIIWQFHEVTNNANHMGSHSKINTAHHTLSYSVLALVFMPRQGQVTLGHRSRTKLSMFLCAKYHSYNGQKAFGFSWPCLLWVYAVRCYYCKTTNWLKPLICPKIKIKPDEHFFGGWILSNYAKY